MLTATRRHQQQSKGRNFCQTRLNAIQRLASENRYGIIYKEQLLHEETETIIAAIRHRPKNPRKAVTTALNDLCVSNKVQSILNGKAYQMISETDNVAPVSI